MFSRFSSRFASSACKSARSYSTTQSAQQSYSNYIQYGTIGAVTLGSLAYYSLPNFKANDALAPPAHPWDHTKIFNSLDHMALRRGFIVYREVCSACHSLEFIAWRHLVGVIGTEDEVKEWAADTDVEDGPDDKGNMFERPGKLTDHLPKPYPNDNAARDANNKALPPDLSLIKKARVGGEDYLFSLLTGYREAPHGVTLREGLYYNPYFPGSAIGMEQALHEDMVEYEDGTPASISQMAKDVSVFLTWTAEPEHDERKRIGIKAFFICLVSCIPTLYYKRFKWSTVKTRQVRFTKL